MAVLTSIDEAQIRALLEAYSLGDFAAFEGIAAGSVNSNFAVEVSPRSPKLPSRFFLRLYEEQDAEGACLEAALLTRLAASGVPTPAPLERRDGAWIGELAGKPAALFPWRAGEMRCQRSVSVGDAAAVGVALARVHVAAGVGPFSPSRFDERALVERLERIAKASDATLAAQAAPLHAKLAKWGRARDPDLPRGLIHGDLFRDNVLWSGGELVALLDFESASAGIFAYDLMVTLLAWCTGDRLEPDLARAMIAGYERERPLTRGERAGLLAEGCAASLRFAITRITDYAMRVTDGPRTLKDWRRFAQRLESLETLGPAGLREMLGIS